MTTLSKAALLVAGICVILVAFAVVPPVEVTVTSAPAPAATATPAPEQYVFYLGHSADTTWDAAEFSHQAVADPGAHPAYTCEVVRLEETTTAAEHLGIAIEVGHGFRGARVERDGAILSGQDDPCTITTLWSGTASATIAGRPFKVRYTPDTQAAGAYVVTVGVDISYTRYALATTGQVVSAADFSAATTSMTQRVSSPTWPDGEGRHVSFAIPASEGEIGWVQLCQDGIPCIAGGDINQRSGFGQSYQVTVGADMRNVITSNQLLTRGFTALIGKSQPPAPPPVPGSYTRYALVTAASPAVEGDFANAATATEDRVTLPVFSGSQHISVAVPAAQGTLSGIILCNAAGSTCLEARGSFGAAYTVEVSGVSLTVATSNQALSAFFSGGSVTITVTP